MAHQDNVGYLFEASVHYGMEEREFKAGSWIFALTAYF